MAAMARLLVAVILLLSFLAVAHSRLIEPAAAAASLAIADEQDPPKPAAAAEDSEPVIPTELVRVPVHRLAGPGVICDAAFSLRLPTHGRRHPCRHVHAHGHRWWAHRHHGALADGGFPGGARAGFAAAVEGVREGPKSKRAEVTEPDLDTDSDSDDEDEDDEEKMGKDWKKVRRVMRKRFHHDDDDDGEGEETEKRWKKEMKRRFHHGRGRRHHHHSEEEGGVIKWLRDLMHF